MVTHWERKSICALGWVGWVWPKIFLQWQFDCGFVVYLGQCKTLDSSSCCCFRSRVKIIELIDVRNPFCYDVNCRLNESQKVLLLVTSPLNFRKDNFGNLASTTRCLCHHLRWFLVLLCWHICFACILDFPLEADNCSVVTSPDPLISSSFALTSHKDKISWSVWLKILCFTSISCC